MNKIKNLKLPVKIFISIALLLVLTMRMDKQAFLETLFHTQASGWIYATIFVLIQFFTLALRWELLINIGRNRMNYIESLQVTLASLLANMLFITSIGGIFVKIALALQHGASLFKAAFATACDRLLTLTALVLLSAIFIPGLGRYLDGEIYGAICLFLGVFIIALFIFTPLFLNIILKQLPKLPFSSSNITSGIRYIKILINNHTLTAKLLFISLTAQISFFISIYCLTVSANISLSFFDLMTVLPVIAIVSSLPISFGGWGVREGAFIYGLGLLGVPMETAFLISVQTGLVGMIATIIAGVPALITVKSASETLHNFKRKLIPKI